MSLVTEFEDLRIWQEARLQVICIYEIFRGCNDFSFKDQIQRAAISVMNNIAEGFERATHRDFANFLTIAKASCGEVRSMLFLAADLGYASSAQAAEARSKAKQLSRSIKSLSKTLQTKK
jgi:four helix bundle protein